MTDAAGIVSGGLADRLWTRLAAQDRLDALEERPGTPTCCERLRTDPVLLESLVEEGIDEMLSALADRRSRAALRALRAGDRPEAGEELVRRGLAVASWTGDRVTVSAAGETLSVLLDEVARRALDELRSRLDRQGQG